MPGFSSVLKQTIVLLVNHQMKYKPVYRGHVKCAQHGGEILFSEM